MFTAPAPPAPLAAIAAVRASRDGAVEEEFAPKAGERLGRKKWMDGVQQRIGTLQRQSRSLFVCIICEYREETVVAVMTVLCSLFSVDNFSSNP